MKKILSVVLALAVIMSLAICAAAATADITTDKAIIAPGDKVVVTIKMDEEVPANLNVTSVQIEVGYDKDLLTFESGAAGTGYDFLTVIKASSRKPVVQVNSGTDFNVKTLPAGTVATVTFVAKETTTVENLDLTLTFKAPDQTGALVVDASDAASITICPNHNVVTNTVAGDCKNKGYTEHKCETCGYSVVEEGTYGDHGTTTLVGKKDATCTEKGYTGDEVCSICGETVKKGEDIDTVAHTYGEWVETKAPTCTEKGEKTCTCSVCGDKKTEEIAALGHDVAWTVTKEPTCTEKGEKTGTCARCGLTVTEEIPALGHDVTEWTVTKEPTCTEKGEKTGTCARCNETVTEEIDALGHDYKDGVCQNCGEKDPNYVPPTTKPEKDDVPPTGDSIGVVVALLAVSALTVAFTVKRKED